jgi:hypothetical protein
MRKDDNPAGVRPDMILVTDLNRVSLRPTFAGRICKTEQLSSDEKVWHQRRGVKDTLGYNKS